MKKAIIFSFIAIFLATTSMASMAQAKRFGGGSSFGKSFSSPKSMNSPAAKQNLNSAPSAAKSPTATPSRAGGMMGILGGLAMGGLLGALFFGGAFEGINFMDILLFAGIAFAIFWWMRRAARNRTQPEYAHAGPASYQPSQPESSPTSNTSYAPFSGAEATSSPSKPVIDHEQIIHAARAIFMRMQASWDAKDMDDIRAFSTADVANHVQSQLLELGNTTTKTEVGMLNAEIADTWIESDLEWVAVHFTAMIKEETLDAEGKSSKNASHEANEYWMFQHDANSDDPTWYLAGIQQG